MKRPTSRRDFLELSALGPSNVVPGELVRPSVALAEPAYGVIPASPEISAWVTAGQERFAPAPKTNWNPAAAPPAADYIQPSL
jgi:hypothetical protein